MAEEDLTPQQKLTLAANFISNSPPGQVSKVVEGEQPSAPPLSLPCLLRALVRALE